MEKLAELKARMAEKRTKKAVEEAKEAKANEQLRRKSGKVTPSSSCRRSWLTGFSRMSDNCEMRSRRRKP